MKADLSLTDAEKKALLVKAEVPRCSMCERDLKDPAERIRSAGNTLCLDCYEGLIDPFPKRCHAGLLF